MADKVFIGGLCPKFIICSDWFVNGNGIEWARVYGVVFYADELALGLGCASATGGRGWDVWIVCGVFCFGGSVAFIGLGNMG